MLSKMLNNIQNIKNGSTTIEHIVYEKLAILEQENPKVNAIVEYHPQELIEQAKELDEKIRNGFQGKLCGATITVKDNLDVKGYKATAGMIRFKDNISDVDCNIVKKLRDEGAIILGKTNMPAGAMDMQTNNKVYGRTNHPKFFDRTCGGSSGGGACAVALGISDIDIGNDFMGSIRVPSHFCGTYGLIATDNAISLEEIVGGKPYGSTMSKILRIGLQASTLLDLEYIFPIITNCGRVFPQRISQSILKIAYTKRAGGLVISKEYEKCYQSFIEKLSQQHTLKEITDEEFDFEEARNCFLKLLYGNIAITLSPAIRFMARKLGGKKYMTTNLKDYLLAEEGREKCINQLEKILYEFDVLLSPVSATSAFEHQNPIRMQGEQAVYGEMNIDNKMVSYSAANMGYTTPFSLTSSPVITIPIGQNNFGLPFGLQVIGKRNHELDLLQNIKELCKHENY